MSLNPSEYFLTVIVIANAIAGVSGMLASAVLIHRLKSRHRLQWEALGSPGMLSNSLAITIRYQRYIFGSGYRALNDRVIIRLALVLKTCMVLVIVFLATALTIVVLHLLIYLPPGRRLVVDHPLSVNGAALIAALVLWNAANIWLWRYLRTAHPQTWTELGNPSFGNLTIANSWKTLQYLWSADHNRLTDPTLSIALYCIRSLMVLTAVAWFVLGPLAAK